MCAQMGPCNLPQETVYSSHAKSKTGVSPIVRERYTLEVVLSVKVTGLFTTPHMVYEVRRRSWFQSSQPNVSKDQWNCYKREEGRVQMHCAGQLETLDGGYGGSCTSRTKRANVTILERWNAGVCAATAKMIRLRIIPAIGVVVAAAPWSRSSL
ncbi:hypothetical protein TNCV_1156091 [Trichonephila clavipes]|nr:hypothetical protein TNCV_1156091 [Trichonephila clavipes]